MTAAESAVAELESLIKDLPELVHVLLGGAGHVDEIDGNDALVETAVVFVLSVDVISGSGFVVIVAETFRYTFVVRCEEASASHAGIHITVLVFLHLLCGDVVGNHALSGAFRRKLGQIVVL